MSHFAEILFQLLEVYCTTALTEADAELYGYLVNATFAAVAGRGASNVSGFVPGQYPTGTAQFSHSAGGCPRVPRTPRCES